MRTMLHSAESVVGGVPAVRRLLLAILSLLLAGTSKGQIVWDGNGGSSGAWFTASNWNPDSLPQTTSWLQFPSFANVATEVSINFGSPQVNNGPGNEAVGAIELTSSRTNALTIRNSSGSVPGTLTLNGAQVNGVDHVVLRNNSTSSLTLRVDGNAATAQNMSVALGDPTNNIIAIDGSGSITITSPVKDGAGNNLTVQGTGSGKLTLSGPNTYTGITAVNSGTLILGADNTLATSTTPGSSYGVMLSGGALSVNGTTQGNNTGSRLGTLTLSTNSAILLTTGDSSQALFFNDYNRVSGGLTIAGWDGQNNLTSGTGGRLYFARSADLTAQELENITFSGFGAGASLINYNETYFELVPVPEPSTIVTGCALLGLVVFRERVSLKQIFR